MNAPRVIRVTVLSLLITFLIITIPYGQTLKEETPDAKMLRYPDVSAEHIVFVFADDLWIVSRDGGDARRLSSVKGHELYPKFSPDGKSIAFSGNYDGNIDAYIIPANGGIPGRLTHHPDDDLVVDWYPDGKEILLRSKMLSPTNRYNRFFKQSVEGGLPLELPLAYGELASFSPDGKQIAFQFISPDAQTWKRYRGGMASDIWIYDFNKKSSVKFTEFEGTDGIPMWHENTIYFLSDRGPEKKLNIWAYDVNTKKIRQVTFYTEFDVKWPSLGPDSIVFENGGSIYLLSLKDETSRPIDIVVQSDLPDLRPRLKDLSKYIENFSLSPSGKRALFEARGEIFSLPETRGIIRNLTNTSGIAERFPTWSPDGKSVAYFSDSTGDYQLYTLSSDGSGKEKQIGKSGINFPNEPIWSPDSKQIAFSDLTGSLYIVNLNDYRRTVVDKDEWFPISSFSWSPDSRYLAYSKRMPNSQGAIMIYDVGQKKLHQVTSAFYHDISPVFSPDGKYLFFYSNRSFNPVYSDVDETWIYPNSTEILAATLRKDIKSPLAPNSDEEVLKDINANDQNKSGNIIDFEGLEGRVVKLPIEAGNFGQLEAVEGKVIYIRFPAAGSSPQNKPSGKLLYYDLNEGKEKTIIQDINYYELSADGKKVIYKSDSTYGIIDLSEGKKVGDGRLPTDKMKALIDPREEWSQIFNEAWRIERDFFYDPNMHGVNWNATKERYKALLPYVVDREDLNYIIGEMISELNSSHTYVRGGEIERAEEISVGLLGCDFELDKFNNVYRIIKIYKGGTWDAEVRSPLTEPGVNVSEGEYLIAINGTPLDKSKDPWEALHGLANEVVTITINNSPTFKGSREILVKPISRESDYRLRYLSWVEDNRKKVEDATNSRVGYIYVPNTGQEGQNELLRQFIPQTTKEALIIDERFNGGGQIPDRFIEVLNRPIFNYWARRDQLDLQTPILSHHGPKVMIINGWSGSGGDAFPYYFRKAGLGPLIGTRTLGALIGIGESPGLIDGGIVTVPSFAFWDSNGKWEVEGYGVDPDYEIENAPNEVAAGTDRQLDKAIEVITDILEKHPPKKPQRPDYPDRSEVVN
ncbi:MAG: S41 family peptidase [Thermodesulfobacteriota bacterium]